MEKKVGITGHFQIFFQKTAFSYSNTYKNRHDIWSIFWRWTAKKFKPRLPENIWKRFQQKIGMFMFKNQNDGATLTLLSAQNRNSPVTGKMLGTHEGPCCAVICAVKRTPRSGKVISAGFVKHRWQFNILIQAVLWLSELFQPHLVNFCEMITFGIHIQVFRGIFSKTTN